MVVHYIYGKIVIETIEKEAIIKKQYNPLYTLDVQIVFWEKELDEKGIISNENQLFTYLQKIHNSNNPTQKSRLLTTAALLRINQNKLDSIALGWKKHLKKH